MIETTRINIKVMSKEHASELLHYHIENSEHLAPWQPQRSEDYLTLDNWQKLCASNELAFKSGNEVKLVAFHKETHEIVGICSFTGIFRGAFQACFLGYSVAQKYEGNGYMTEILAASIGYMFDVVGLNRVMATYMPRNESSEKVLRKLGFEKEGVARKYLKIAGQWEDHILTSKLNERT